jgi:hypothetical protein
LSKIRNVLGASIFSALVGPRPVLSPEDGTGGGATVGTGGDAAPAATEPAADAKPAADGAAGEPSALAGYKAADEKPATEGEPKPEGEEKPAAEGKDKPDEAPADDTPKDIDGKPIPEAYELKMPDGVEMDADLLAVATPMLREAKLSPAQAQVVADLYMKTQTDAIQKHQDTMAGWLKEAKADDEIGKRDWDKNLAHAHRAFKTFGTDEAMTLFDNYGLGNHPEILRIFVRMGKAIGEGGTVLPGEAGQRVSDAKVMYPEMYKS